MSGQSGGHRVCLPKLNEQLTCRLCGGYFIDATTIIECLHSFCRSCIVKYLENNKYCPICEVQVHKSRPLLNIRPDYTLQDIVYKLVPGCYQNEMRCRREFYAKHPGIRDQVTSPEARGEPTESHIYSPDESLSLSLEYFNPHTEDLDETNAVKDATQKPHLKRYLRCPAAVTVFHLQKLIRAKYGLSDAHRVDIMYKEEPLCSSYTLMDVMYIYHWRRKVPLHLSYRIFESSSKRIKLSEDNASYKKSLTNAGIHSDEMKDEKSLKREWKEVQLKISETGVMSITDISNTVLKREAETENPEDPKISDETVTTIATVNKADSLVENCSVPNACLETMQPIVVIDALMMKNATLSDSSSAPLATSDVKTSTDDNSPTKNCTSLPPQHGGNTTTRQASETANHTAPVNSQQDAEAKVHDQTNNAIEDKAISQGQKAAGQTITQCTEESAPTPLVENTSGMDTRAKRLTINNNNNNNNNSTDSRSEAQKECMKSELKVGNVGSKIDALSAKLQFQPKMGQVNNTYSKKAPKEKRAIFQSAKKSDAKSPTEVAAKAADTKTRANCGQSAVAKMSAPCPTATSPQKPVVSTATAPQTTTSTTVDASAVPSKPEVPHEKDNQNSGIDVQQALNLLEQKRNSPTPTQAEAVSKTTSHASAAGGQRLQQSARSSNTVVTPNESPVPNIPTSTSMSQATFPYTVHDLVTNASLKATLKNPNSALPNSLTASPVACSTSANSQMSPMHQFSMQTPSMSIYSIPTSLKNNCGNASPAAATVTVTSTATLKSSSGPTSTPCPDAIPISLLKPSLRKQEATAKGSNLNEICAKIGSNTTGSKINDICAKIGENSKEKNRVEARSKSDIPDLLKIAKKSPSPSDTSVKHIPNIPNVPVYTPSSNATTVEAKGPKVALPTSTAAALAVSTPPASSHASQRISVLKKQSQPIGYKTLRDPPKSWNPTLSKNNYVAVKNQAKEMQNQTQTAASEGTSKQIPSKPAKIFKMRNMPRYLGNPASGVKPMYGVANDTKEKEQSAANAVKGATLNMMKIDPKTLSPIVSTANSPIVSPPPYSPNARSYQNTPFPRDICRSTGSPLSSRNSPVNMLSTNPFIPSPTPNTNPRIIYSHFPPPFPDASRFPNPLIRSPIGIPPPSAFHSSLPPSINKLYQRSSYIPQTTGYSPVVGQPPAVQRIPPSTHSSSPKSPKASSPGSISSFNLGKTEPITSTVNSVALLLSKSVPVPVPVPMPVNIPVSVSHQRELNAFNLSKTGGSLAGVTSNIAKTADTSDGAHHEPQTSKQNSGSSVSLNPAAANLEVSENSSSPCAGERKQGSKDTDAQKAQEGGQASKPKIADGSSPTDKKEKNQTTKVNGDVTTEHFGSKKSKEYNNEQTTTTTTTTKPPTPTQETTEREGQVERSSPRERNSIQRNNAPTAVNDSSANDSKAEDLGKTGEQIQGKKSEVQRNKAET
ncbi:PREDICTED: polycomb group protein Psc-like [Dinoponera quadriceps]|uniref:Polycomb group protein Psc-like n=1 Tax=Dinoponera quadriceps TaxID=609295 RepID=A0A6P3XC53_DINQU|nr:PREDICTED: polycomb group protein Psc-like [Dinoponera quadriceps]